MKRIILSGLILAATGITILSCNKENVETVLQTSLTKTNEKSAQISYEDYTVNDLTIGQYHNSMMTYMKKEKDKLISLNFSKTEGVVILEEKFKSKIISDLEITSTDFDEFIYDKCKINYDVNSSYNLESQFYNSLELIDSSLAKDLDKYINTDNFYNDKLFIKETNILKNKYLGTENDFFVSLITDVSLNSRNFWMNFDDLATYNNKDGIWQADVSGAVIGGAWGAVAGGFAGGIGALPGGLLGGCISASYGSTAAALWSLW